MVLDEAYVDFAEDHAEASPLKHPHVIIAHFLEGLLALLSNAWDILSGIRNSSPRFTKRGTVNVNGLGQIATAEATSATSLIIG